MQHNLIHISVAMMAQEFKLLIVDLGNLLWRG